MKTKSRIASILKANSLDSTITGLQTFNLSELKLSNNYGFQLTKNIKLGHLVENIVAKLITLSSNYKILYKNIQIFEDKISIGELDFIIENMVSKQVIHVELAYKFYLFDPNISSELIDNWIGPNRKDTLKEKINKLKNKQFPLLYHKCTLSRLNNIVVKDLSQALCFLVSLFIPYKVSTR